MKDKKIIEGLRYGSIFSIILWLGIIVFFKLYNG